MGFSQVLKLAKRVSKIGNDQPALVVKNGNQFDVIVSSLHNPFIIIGPNGQRGIVSQIDHIKLNTQLDTINVTRIEPSYYCKGALNANTGQVSLFSSYPTSTQYTVWLPYIRTVNSVNPNYKIQLTSGQMSATSVASFTSGEYLGTASRMTAEYPTTTTVFSILRVKDYQLRWRKDYALSSVSACTDIIELNPATIMATGHQSSRIWSVIIDTAGNELNRVQWLQHPFGQNFQETWVLPTNVQSRFVVVGNTYGTNPEAYIGVHNIDGSVVWGSFQAGYAGRPVLFSDGTFGVPSTGLSRTQAQRLANAQMRIYPNFGNQVLADVNLVDTLTATQNFLPMGMVHEGGDSVIVWGYTSSYDSRDTRKNDVMLYRIKGLPTEQAPVVITNLNGLASSAKAFSLSPNPAHGQVSVSNAGKQAAVVQVINPLGQQVLQQALPIGSTVLDISKLSPGLYFVKVGTWVERLVVE
jgi:hypothetical protein